MKSSKKGSAGVIAIVIAAVVVIAFGIYYASTRDMMQTDEATTTTNGATTTAVGGNGGTQGGTGTNSGAGATGSAATTLQQKVRGAEIGYVPAGMPATSKEGTAVLTNGKYEYVGSECGTAKCAVTFLKAEYPDIDSDGDYDVIATFAHSKGGATSEQEVKVFRNDEGVLKYLGTMHIGNVNAYTSVKVANKEITITYNSVFAGAAGWTTPVTTVYAITDNDIVKKL